ncbi:Hypothetical predicted protein [Olea europaea subsp. europaea]|uniref:Uncharacterized protein n=1 Tax=Olea europaea subsp. europaea TaxID=158383 RepID=A0A8S0PSK7_OLEEU|nr:Hypothetical predicted protein [Olea europaea subsp. europaea]
MSGSGGFAVSRSHGGDRFYNPPAVRRHQQMLLQQQPEQQVLQQQQQQQHRQKHQLPRAPVKSESSSAAAVVEAGNRSESDDSTKSFSRPSSVSSASPPRPMPVNVTNLDRLMDSVTPFVPAQNFSEVRVRRRKMQEVESLPFYCLEDLWESFREWSVYGAGVPLLLNGKDLITQYYVPYLSGIQLYIDESKPPPHRRRPGEESDSESSRETSSAGSSDREADKRSKSPVDGCRPHQNAQQLNRLSTDKFVKSSSSDEAEISNWPGLLLFEYLEQEQPHLRKPLSDKISILASQFPELRQCRSCDLLPSSWISVAWYPIYRIPVSPTLKDLDASFLTFHSLSTLSRSNFPPRFHAAYTRRVRDIVDPSSKISLPVFGLASYKLKGSLLSPTGPRECEQENYLLQSADNWLRNLQVNHPDYQFFRTHYSQRR